MTKPYHNGPIPDEDRKCTDYFCCIALLLLIFVLLGFAIYSWIAGSLSILATGFDSDGKQCSVDYPDYPYVYFANPYSSSSITTCVKYCPTSGDTSIACKPNSKVPSCMGNDIQIYDSKLAFNSFCRPRSKDMMESIQSSVQLSGVEASFVSLSNCWPIFFIALVVAIILSIIFMLLVRFCANILLTLLVIVGAVVLLILGIYLLACDKSSIPEAAKTQALLFYIVVGILCIVLAIFLLSIFFCYRKKLTLASTIVQVAARFVKQNFILIGLLVGVFFVILIFLVLWVFEALAFYSLGNAVQPQQGQTFRHFELSIWVKILLLVHVLQLFWVLIFLVQTADFLIQGTAVGWYFQQDNNFGSSFGRYRKFHIGSVAFGSFLFAILGFIKFIYQLLTSDSGQKQGPMKYIDKCCSLVCCCCTCLINLLNNGAYSFIHLSGESYCPSAIEVVKLRLKQPFASFIVMIAEQLVSFMIRLCVTALTCLICYLIMQSVDSWKVTDPTFPLILIGVIGFIVSYLFASLYSESIQAIYVCYLVDRDAGGGEDRCPQEFREMLAQQKGMALPEDQRMNDREDDHRSQHSRSSKHSNH